ncbi:hypothetical protein ABBQ38_001476 [Trebouxia sp. C0009 RCD-2024]
MNMDQPDRKYFNPDGSTNFFARDGAYVGTFFGNNGVEEAYAAHYAKYGRRKPKKLTPKELNTLFWNAVASSDVPLAKRLRKRGASVHIKGPDPYGGCSLLALACKQGCLTMIQFLLKCGAKAKQDLVGFANDATNTDRPKIFEALLRHGAKAQYWGGDKLLLGACEHPSELEVLKVLLKAGVATTARANKGVCPLVTACIHANWPAAELLVKRRTDKVDNVDTQGRTPLMLACQAGRIDLVKSLMKRNAKVTVCSHEGLQAWQYTDRADIAKLVDPKYA